jgi:PAS domain S-box-containing protein
MRPFLLAVCWYVVPGLIWVLASDAIVAAFVGDPSLRAQISFVKGLAFVGVSGFVIYRLLARQRAAQEIVEAAFSESERGFQLLFKNNPLPVWAYDRQTLKFLEINDVALAKYGYSREELLAMKVTDVHPPDEVPELLKAIATPRELREVSGVWRHRLKDGQIIEVEVQVHDLDLRGHPARMVVALDVTERRRAFLAEQRFREVVEGLDAIVWEADAQTHCFTFVSQQAETMLGYPLAVWTSGEDVLAHCMSPQDRERVGAFLAGVSAGHLSIPIEVRARAASGESVWLRIDAAAHSDTDGRVSQLRGTITDVTGERDHAERAARDEKLRALGQLSSGVAHDLNQSLALIAGYGELLQQTLDDQPTATDRLREMAEVMLRAASDGGETVRRMLTFVRTPKDEANGLLDLSSVMHEVVRLTAPRWRDASQAEGRPIELTLEVEGDVTIRGNAATLREALTNLVLNAVDALPRGGAIGLSAQVEGDRAVVKVADEGIGMSDDVKARIFEPFFTTKGEGGTGLGLPSVFGIVEAHGGELAVWSEPERGTTFTLSFPLAETAQSEPPRQVAAKQAPEPATATSTGLRCLVVDDEPQLARMLSTMLRRLGHEAVPTVTGEDALAVLAARPIDVLLTDVGMGPSMNGWELAERARQLRPDLPVILATGWGASIDQEQARDRGVLAVLAKPYRQADLEQALTRLLTPNGQTSGDPGSGTDSSQQP